MKKWIFVILLWPSLTWGAVTQQQAQQARDASNELVQLSQKMLSYASVVNALFDSGFVLSISGSTETVTIPQATQDKLIDTGKYQALKAQLVAAFNKLP